MTQAGTKDHPITIEPLAGRVTAVWRGKTVADSARALELNEAGYKPVVYFPRADANMSALERTDRVTSCPYKGRANYYSLVGENARDENAVWTYETPIAAVAEIAGHLAFYPNRVEVKRGRAALA
ncbi:MAG TPA: DUF427 domain-containing protein [Roseiarcus sp.]|nr:DUF427 domain-containing protein [Roseiarcus sp.]